MYYLNYTFIKIISIDRDIIFIFSMKAVKKILCNIIKKS